MNIKEYTKWMESEDYTKLDNDSNVIIYKNTTGEIKPWEWGVWGERDVWDELLIQNQKEYPKIDIKRMKVSDILKQDSPEYYYLKKWALDELNKNKY